MRQVNHQVSCRVMQHGSPHGQRRVSHHVSRRVSRQVSCRVMQHGQWHGQPHGLKA